MLLVDVLKSTKARIQDPKNWIQGYYIAKDNDPNCRESEANQWCAIGSLCREANGISTRNSIWDLLTKVAKEMGKETISQVNDQMTHADVMKMFDLAIEKAEAQC